MQATKKQLVLASVLMLAACGKEEKDDGKKKNDTVPTVTGSNGDTSSTDGALPDARPIALAEMQHEGAGLGLTQGRAGCATYGRLGAFGIGVGFACELGPAVGDLLYGKNADSNADGRLTCADYRPGQEDQGILKAMLCDEVALGNARIASVGFLTKKGQGAGLDFADYAADDGVQAVGHWTATGGDEGRYPANIRGWVAPKVGETPQPAFAISLKAAHDGTVRFDATPQGTSMKGAITFGTSAGGEACRKTPSRETCYWQELTLVGEIPLTLLLLADAPQKPTFVVMEGKFSMTEAQSKAWFDKEAVPAGYLATRAVYFQSVAVPGKVWGSYTFRDEAGGLVVAPDANGIDTSALLRGGMCMNAVTAQVEACSTVDVKPAEKAFKGEDALTLPEASWDMGVTFGAVPPAGLVTAK